MTCYECPWENRILGSGSGGAVAAAAVTCYAWSALLLACLGPVLGLSWACLVFIIYGFEIIENSCVCVSDA